MNDCNASRIYPTHKFSKFPGAVFQVMRGYQHLKPKNCSSLTVSRGRGMFAVPIEPEGRADAGSSAYQIAPIAGSSDLA